VGQRRRHYWLMLIQIKQILFLDGKPVFSGRSYGERLEMGTESEKSRIIIMKSVLF
jgi:hypothetical protein